MNPMIKPDSLQHKIQEVQSTISRGLMESHYPKAKENGLIEAKEVCEYAFFEIVRDIPDKASLEVVKNSFRNMLSDGKIEEIIDFVESIRK